MKRRVVAVVGLGDGLAEAAEGVAGEADGVALEAEADVCVDRSGHTDVGMSKEFLDDDELDALLQQECRGRVPQVVKPDRPQVGLAEQCVEVPGQGGRFDRVPDRPGEDVAAALPVRARLHLLACLLLAVGTQ
jgi:hypothetical protein